MLMMMNGCSVDAAVSCSVKLPACDVEVDGPADTAGKLQTAEDCVSTDTSTRQTNVVYSRGCAATTTTTTTTTTTNLTKPGNDTIPVRYSEKPPFRGAAENLF